MAKQNIEMEPVNRGETYPTETITLGFDIAGATLVRELRHKQSGQVVKSWENPGSITVNDSATGQYTIGKWNVTLPAGQYVGEDRITYANGDVQDLWNLSLTISE